jgi:mono/diheme cytochrome c family protein
MSMQRSFARVLSVRDRAGWAGVLVSMLVLGVASAVAADKTGNAARGKQLYMSTGCYQCHGTSGEGGGNAGPRVAPYPMPYEGFLMQVRKPRARMPFYTEVVMPEKDVVDIYAYLLSIPKGKAVDEIPMLKGLTAGSASK